MGLDITARRLVKATSRKKNKEFYYLTDANIKLFKDNGLGQYITNESRQYYDIYKYFGCTEDEYKKRYILTSIEYGPKGHPHDVLWHFVDKAHPAKDLYNKLYDLVIENNDNVSLTVSDIDRIREYGYTGNIHNHSDLFLFLDKLLEVTVLQSKFPIREQVDTGVYCVEVGYQRNGLASDYFLDYREGKFGYFIFDRNTLNDIYDNYVDDEPNDMPSDFHKNNFKEQILKKFIKGKTFVTFDW